ncbi:hypothetical protein [Flagellimonas marina]|jgi:sRNA-binding regulator protein Hfq|uniref:Uncharacterized protein n=1 Tax=Flagellimonas marina TaxID=1775168 RepID=A0ABV8PK18_9FLAO
MKRIAIWLSIVMLAQSCQVYRNVELSEIKKNKTYRIHLNNGQDIQGICESVDGNQVALRVNENVVEFPKTNIDSAERHKVSILKMAGAAVLITAGTLLMLDIAKKDTGSINNP